MIRPEPITVDGRTGVIVFLDADRQPVEPSDPTAVVARAVFDDGGSAIYQVQPPTQDLRHDLYAVDQPRDAQGRFATVEGIQASPQFQQWFGQSAVVDEDGKPLTVYHGTTHDIEEFKPAGAPGLNPESDWGAGTYFSSHPEDASTNYAGEGPDLTNRIEERADRLTSEHDHLTHEAAIAQARGELAGKSASVIPAYLSMQNPVVVGKPNGTSPARETHFHSEYVYADPHDPESDIVGEKGTLPDLLQALHHEAAKYDDNFHEGSKAVDRLTERLSGEESVSASRLVKMWKESDNLIEHPETGHIMNSEVLRAALQRTGFDGVVDRTVNEKFGTARKHGKQMEGIDPDTTHFITFTPTQVKSATGNVTFDPKNPKLVLTYREKLQQFLLGGEGSGNFGHAGRPGEVGGSAEGDASTRKSSRDPIEQKFRDFQALVKRADLKERHLNRLRIGLADAWQRWAEDTKNRKRPLKPDGAAAKKLDTYKEAKALEEQFHAARGEESAWRVLDAKVKEMLKVPEAQRSEVRFQRDASAPLHPGVEAAAARALATFRQYDGSGAFATTRIPADHIEKFREIFGDQSAAMLKPNADGSYALVPTLRLAKAEGERANATIGAVHVTGGNDLDRQVNHEVGHHIEFRSPAVLTAAVQLRDALADTPRTEYSLKTVKPSLDENEHALKGKFPDPYSAKLYPKDVATEITSTGIESYLADPVSFARDRKEHFKFIFDVMHGKYRSKE